MIRRPTPTASGASPAQLEADNYRKPDRFRWNGLQIVIETPKGARRNPAWPPMAAAYGDIKRTSGADGDAVDVFVGPNRLSELVVVIDQLTKGGRFDEHKVMIGFTSTAEAVACYRACYSKGWKVGPVSSMTVGQLRAWLQKGNQQKRISDQLQQFAAECSRLAATSFADAVDYFATQLAFNWDEAAHPRTPTGTPAGGEFTATDSTPASGGPIKSRPVPDKKQDKPAGPAPSLPGTARARHYPGGLAKVVATMAPDAKSIDERNYYISSGQRNARYTLRVRWMDTVGDGEGGSRPRERDNHVDTLAADYKKAEKIAREILGAGATLHAEQFGIGKSAAKRDADVFKFGHYEGKKIAHVLEKDPAYIQSIWMGGWFNASSKHKTFRATLTAAGGGPTKEVAAFRASKEKSWDDPTIQAERERTTAEVMRSIPAIGDATPPKEYKKRATTRFAKGIDWLEDKLRPMYSDDQDGGHRGPEGGLANVRKELERWQGIAIYKGGEQHERSKSVSWHDPFWHGIGDQAARYLAHLPADLVDKHNQKTDKLESKAWDAIGKMPADADRKAAGKAKRDADSYEAPRADYDPMSHSVIIGPQTFGEAVDCFGFDEAQHPRDAAGQATGGEFVESPGGSQPADTAGMTAAPESWADMGARQQAAMASEDWDTSGDVYRAMRKRLHDQMTVDNEDLEAIEAVGGPADKYRASLESAINNMSTGALAKIGDNLGDTRFHQGIDAVTVERYQILNPSLSIDEARSGALATAKRTAGMWAFSREPGSEKGTVHLDGGADIAGSAPQGMQMQSDSVGTYKHELGHVLDGKHQHSTTPAWQAAFAAEIAGGQITKYGATNAKEGWAEFARLVWSEPRYAREEFPQSYGYWKSQGFV